MTSALEDDHAIRAAAFAHVRGLSQTRDQLTAADLAAGFTHAGARIALVNPRRGIFKPRSMRLPLSIRTVFPTPGNRVWYDDQRQVHQQIYGNRDTIEYAFMGDNPDAAENRGLREAMAHRIPLIYFLGISPGRYQAVVPAFVSEWDPAGLKIHVEFGDPQDASLAPPETIPERRYALHAVQKRLHQASFRAAVIAAYGGRCALSGLPEALLLDAAHIIEDKSELGHPIVPNGLPLSKIHHAAFDSHLIGIDSDYKLHVSERLMTQRDGPMLEALKRLDGELIHLPMRQKDYPDRDRLEMRFEGFKKAA